MEDNGKIQINCYKSDKRISEYINNRIKFNKIMQSKNRSRFTTEDKNFDTKLRQDKKKLLNNIIFPSMANIVVFFEKLNENDELRELFDNDIKELFGYVSSEQSPKIMTRLLESILTWDMDKDPNNFRQGLMYEVQLVLRSKVKGLADREFLDDVSSNVNYIIDNQMNQAVAWTGLYYSRYKNSDQGKEDNKNQLPKRPIKF